MAMGIPGRGGINRGAWRCAAHLGQGIVAFDRFKAQALPPGAAEVPTTGRRSSSCLGRRRSRQNSARGRRQAVCAAAGQSAWRRTLAPRHQSAVKKYFEK